LITVVTKRQDTLGHVLGNVSLPIFSFIDAQAEKINITLREEVHSNTGMAGDSIRISKYFLLQRWEGLITRQEVLEG
jgi:hypothetical protein